MSIENLLMALPVILGVILMVACVRDWRRATRARRELNRALEQRWEANREMERELKRNWATGWRPADEVRWQELGQAGKLGNGWEKR